MNEKQEKILRETINFILKNFKIDIQYPTSDKSDFEKRDEVYKEFNNIFFNNNPIICPPVELPMYITSKFGVKRNNSYGYHTGIDIVGLNANKEKVCCNCIAVNDCKVVSAFVGTTAGKLVRLQMIKDDFIYLFFYYHLAKIYVKTGDNVKVGDRIGLMGNTGHSSGAHLHFEVRRYETNEEKQAKKHGYRYGEIIDPNAVSLFKFYKEGK